MNERIKPLAGGRFLFEDDRLENLFSPEHFSEEHKMIMETTNEFMEHQVLPVEERLEDGDFELMTALMKKAGELGLLSTDIPQAYGGLELDKASSMIICESVAKQSSFSITLSGQTGIGSLPIVFFGTEAQKAKYLPDLTTGEKIAAYCLTEPSSGTDALSIKTTAKRSADGEHYRLNGQKQFITNAGFADIFIVFAKIEGKDFSAFIVERDREGVRLGPEEKKMGLKGTSTRSVILEDCVIPADQLLGEKGKGHVIAFNILNIGRLKLAACCLGMVKDVIRMTVRYANERKQFQKPLSAFPLLQSKLADMNILTYALESCVYRTAGNIDRKLNETNAGTVSDLMQAIGEYALECSINKVLASEILHFVADEGVQIHGGYGYVKDYKVEKIYRDARIYRIFEGTNEINRLLIPKTILKKYGREPDVMRPLPELLERIKAFQPPENNADPLHRETHFVSLAKDVFSLLFGLTAETFQDELDSQQEIMSDLSDVAIRIYAMESALMRTKKRLQTFGEKRSVHAVEMTQVFIRQGMKKIRRLGEDILTELGKPEWTAYFSVLQDGAQPGSYRLKRNIAARMIEKETYIV